MTSPRRCAGAYKMKRVGIKTSTVLSAKKNKREQDHKRRGSKHPEREGGDGSSEKRRRDPKGAVDGAGGPTTGMACGIVR